jgi:hypothetical protein
LFAAIAENTNKKARMSTGSPGTGRPWTPTSGAEIKAWFASLIIWSLLKILTFLQLLKFELDTEVVRRWFPNIVRWEQIKRFLKVSDPEKDPLHTGDRMYKVRLLYDCFLAACRICFWPGREIAIDEAIKKFKGRCIFRQYIKNKPVRWGIKAFCVNDSDTSYLWNFEFYLGKSEEADIGNSVLEETVLRLLGPLRDKNHVVHMDNYYTSVPLFHKLAQLGIRSTGAIRSNRKYIDKEVLITQAEQTKLAPGHCVYSSAGDLVLTNWFDKRCVLTLSNAYGPEGDLFVEHWYNAKAGDINVSAGGKVLKQVPIPPVVKKYREHMGGTDTFDQYRSYIKLDLKARKFWHPMMFFIVESAMANAWILYKVTMEQAGKDLQFSHFHFRKAIAYGLAAEWDNMGACSRTSEFSPTKEAKEKTFHKIRRLGGIDEGGDRFTSIDKHARFHEKIPCPEHWKKTCRQLLCSVCETAKATNWCKACRAPLCDVKCFVHYHTDPDSLKALLG